MTVAHTPHRAHKRLKPLIDFARKEGWAVVRTPGGHLTFTKSGLPPIYTGSVAGNLLAYRNAQAHLRRAEQTAGTSAMTRQAGSDG
jgi:hypothetical protein